MKEAEDLTNLANYKILIQTKKNRRLKRKEKYLTAGNDLVIDINQALIFPNLQAAEERLSKILHLFSPGIRPRIIIKYIPPKPNATPENNQTTPRK